METKTAQSSKRPEQLFGISCCGVAPMNEFEDICCDNVTRHRRQGSGFVNKCCGNETLNYDQTCCQGVVHNVPNGECCGPQAYARNTHNILCCNGTLNSNVEPGSTCCGSKPFDGGIKENCCGGEIFLKDLFDGCCPVLNSKTPKYKQFNLKTHLCCDVPIERESNTKCCYLRNSNGTFTPKSYDFTTSCCAYPFTSITQKSGGTCIPGATASPQSGESTTQEPATGTTTQNGDEESSNASTTPATVGTTTASSGDEDES
ncbi:hypothetical protein M3Y97_00383100 [Aphelenchoides bicaudatus]|nr:hypothetical protein M3Y97_00383100 [Aphelenchoides bicaudatus]